MKKFIMFIIFVLTVIPINANTDQRLQWWKSRTVELIGEKKLIAEENTQLYLNTYVENNLKRADIYVKQYDDYQKNLLSMNDLSSSFTLDDVKQLTGKSAAAYYSICFEKFLLDEIGKPKWNKQALGIAATNTMNFINNNVQNSSPMDYNSAEKLFTASVSSQDLKSLYMEMFIFSAEQHFNSNIDEAVKIVVADVIEKSGNSSKFNKMAIRDQIAKSIISLIDEKYVSNNFLINENFITDTSAWHNFQLYIGNNISMYNLYNDIVNNGDKKITFSEYEDLRNAGLDENKVFSEIMKRRSGSESLKILMDTLDKENKQIVKNIKGFENSEDYSDYSKLFDTIIDKWCAQNSDIKETDISDVKAFCKLNISRIKYLSLKKFVNPDSLIKQYDRQISNNKKVINFISSLEGNSVENGSPCKEFDDIYLGTGKRVFELLKTVNYYAAFNYKNRTIFTKNQLVEINNLKKGFDDYYLNSNKEISNYRKEKKAVISNTATELITAYTLINEKMAQHEINLLLESVNEGVKLYESLNYPKEVFNNYAAYYNSVNADILNGNFTDKAEKIFSDSSIFPSLETYDGQKLSSEIKAKNYLRKQVLNEAARLKTIVDLHKKKHRSITTTFTQKDIDDIRNSIGIVTSIEVDSWKISENNFNEIDKTLVNSLKQRKNKNFWNRNSASDNSPKKADKEYSIDTVNVKILIPYEWEKKIISDDNFIFFNSVNNSTISIEKSSINGKSEKELMIDYNNLKKYKTVQAGWQKFQKTNFYWTINKNTNGKVVKTFLFIKDDTAVIISGESEKKVFYLLNSYLDTIAGSIKL